MARHTKVGQQTVDAAHAIEAQKTLQVAEILANQAETLVVDSVARSVAVAVESVEAPVGSQALQDGTRVATAAKRHVDINPVRPDVQPLKALIQHHRYVICPLFAMILLHC